MPPEDPGTVVTEPEGSRAAGRARSREELEEERARLKEVHQEEFAWSVLDSDAQYTCGREAVPHRDPRFYRDEEGDVWTANVKRCSNVWACPTCAPRVAARRGEELEEAIRRHRAQGGAVLFGSVTLPHHAGHHLSDLVEALLESWRYVKSGSPWQRVADRIEYVGAVKAVDATVGENGWHPHLHPLIFVEGDLHPHELVECSRWDPELNDGDGGWRPSLLTWLRDRWARKIEAWYSRDGELRCRRLNRKSTPAGFEPCFGTPSRRHGVKLYRATEGAGRYTSKMGLAAELTGIDGKRGRGGNRTPWEVLRDYADHGREEDARLWTEYCRAFAGGSLDADRFKSRRMLTWSPGLRQRLLEDAQEELDLEEREPEDEDEFIARVQAHLWRELSSVLGSRVERETSLVLRDLGLEAAAAWMQGELRSSSRGPPGRPEVRCDPDRRYIWLESDQLAHL